MSDEKQAKTKANDQMANNFHKTGFSRPVASCQVLQVVFTFAQNEKN